MSGGKKKKRTSLSGGLEIREKIGEREILCRRSSTQGVKPHCSLLKQVRTGPGLESPSDIAFEEKKRGPPPKSSPFRTKKRDQKKKQLSTTVPGGRVAPKGRGAQPALKKNEET